MKIRKNLTFPPGIVQQAEELMRLRHFDDLSAFLSQLVREEWERRHGPTLLPSPAAPASASVITKKPASDAPPAAGTTSARRKHHRPPPRPGHSTAN